jgi:transcriptional regulator GlxA family with amidase domain
MAQAGAHSEGMRPYFLWTLDGAVTLLATEGVLTEARARDLFERIESDFSRVAHPLALIDGFELQLAQLGEALARHGVADRDERLRVALSWLEKHLDSTNPLETTARRAGLAPSSFRRAFRRARGQSFAKWLRQARLDAARTLLSHSDLPVATVAARVGFSEVHTFIRNFRQTYALTPGAYRRGQFTADTPVVSR